MSERPERLFGEKLEGEAPPRTNAAIQKLAGIGADAPRTIEELLERLPELAPDQRDAPPSRACILRADGEIEPHITFAWMTRGEDPEPVIVGLWEALKRYFEHRTGPVYWRRRPSVSIDDEWLSDEEGYAVRRSGKKLAKASCRVTRSDGTFFDTAPGLAVDPA